MVSTNDKKVREAMQRHVLSFYKGMGGKTALVEQIVALMGKGPYDRRGRTPYQAGAYMAEGATFLVYTGDQRALLHRLGFTDDRRIDKFRNSFGDAEWGLYVAMCARACEEIYNDYMKKHPNARMGVRRY